VPSVDVIVPCYNYGRFLRACVGSVLAQEDCAVRVLIIDDASTDDSLATARSIAAEDPRVEVIAHETNRGHIATYNEGIAWLRAEYMLLLSSDDMLAPGALARAARLMAANSRVSFVYGAAIQFEDAADIAAGMAGRPAATHAAATVEDGPAFIRRLCAQPTNPIETATAVVRTKLQQRVGGYRPELPHSGDMEMWLRLAARGDVGAVPAVQAFTRIHASNMRHGYKAERVLADYEQRRRAFEIFFDGQSGFLAEAKALRRLACRSLAEEVLWAAVRCYEESNDPAASRLVDLARTIDPSITRTAIWWKTAAKRILGLTVWRAVAPRIAALRARGWADEPGGAA